MLQFTTTNQKGDEEIEQSGSLKYITRGKGKTCVHQPHLRQQQFWSVASVEKNKGSNVHHITYGHLRFHLLRLAHITVYLVTL